ncbi:MAG: LamG-like jellyroll fold domain-containing protein [Bacteroidota bacterium]
MTLVTGPSCSGPVNVGQFTKPFGLQFSNSPQIVTGTYTLELAVKFTDLTGGVRLVGFSTGDDGFYISPNGGSITLFDGTIDNHLPVTIDPATWYHIIFTRNGATKDVSLYVNNVFVGTYNDAADVFVPKAINSNLITFLKDDVDNTEESDGSVARLSVFNKVLTRSQIANSYNNVCTPAFAFLAPNFSQQGYQWTFGLAPYNSSPADAASTGNYPLSAIGSGSISTFNTSVGLGGCVGNIDVGQYLRPIWV